MSDTNSSAQQSQTLTTTWSANCSASPFFAEQPDLAKLFSQNMSSIARSLLNRSTPWVAHRVAGARWAAPAARVAARTVAPRCASVHTEAHMKEQGITLPAFQDAVWSYVKAQRDGDKLYIGDHVGQDESATTVRGKVGVAGEPDTEVTEEEAERLAENAALRLLSTLSHYCDGDLDKVDQVIMVNGFVNGTTHFRGHGKVINGCSNMLVKVLGDRGKHARTCTGSGSLPAAVTCDMVVRLKQGA